MNIINFFIPPIMGGLIALFTNWLAIRMLFRPRTAKYIFGIKLPFTPGLIPKEWTRLSKKMSEAISSRLLTPEVLAQELADPWTWLLPNITIGELLESHTWKEPTSQKLKELADNIMPKAYAAIPTIAETHQEKLKALTYKVIEENISGFTGLFISRNKIYNSIKDGLLNYVTHPENQELIRQKVHEGIDLMLSEGVENINNFHIKDGLTKILSKEKHTLDRVLEVIAKYLSENLPIQNMIENKLEQFSVAEAEEVILSVAGRELRVIVLLGGVLGFGIGLLVGFL